MSPSPSSGHSMQRYMFISRRKSVFKVRKQKLERGLATSLDTRVTTAISIGFMILKLRRSLDTEMLCFRSKDRVFLTIIKGILSLEDKPSIHLPPFLEVLGRQSLLLARFNNQFISRYQIHVWKKSKTKKILSLQPLHKRRKVRDLLLEKP